MGWLYAARMDRQVRRLTINAKVTVEVTDAQALEAEALRRVAVAEFVADADHSVEEIRAAESADVRGDMAAALSWLTNEDAIVEAGAGVMVVGSTHEVVNGDGVNERKPSPDFAVLFAACQCGGDDCEACSGVQLTPRTAAMLWSVAQIDADFAYDDVQQHGDDPVVEDDGWALFGDYPRITWSQDAVWRRQAARAFDDLAEDLASGRVPSPTCPGEEMAMHLMLRSAQSAAQDGWGASPVMLAGLPEHTDDYDWDLLFDLVLQDDDILQLFDEQLDGIEDPEAEANRGSGMGDYRPAAWFRPFLNATRRDGRRGFRR